MVLQLTTNLTERQENTLEEGGGLEKGLSDCHVQVEVEALVLGDVITNTGQKHEVKVPAVTQYTGMLYVVLHPSNI